MKSNKSLEKMLAKIPNFLHIERDNMSEPTKTTIKIVHNKLSGYRVYPADGAWGALGAFGATPMIHLTFYTERPALPTAANYDFVDNKMVQMTAENDQITHRDFEADISMTIDAAKMVHSVLGNFIALAEGKLVPVQNER